MIEAREVSRAPKAASSRRPASDVPSPLEAAGIDDVLVEGSASRRGARTNFAVRLRRQPPQGRGAQRRADRRARDRARDRLVRPAWSRSWGFDIGSGRARSRIAVRYRRYRTASQVPTDRQLEEIVHPRRRPASRTRRYVLPEPRASYADSNTLQAGQRSDRDGPHPIGTSPAGDTDTTPSATTRQGPRFSGTARPRPTSTISPDTGGYPRPRGPRQRRAAATSIGTTTQAERAAPRPATRAGCAGGPVNFSVRPRPRNRAGTTATTPNPPPTSQQRCRQLIEYSKSSGPSSSRT